MCIRDRNNGEHIQLSTKKFTMITNYRCVSWEAKPQPIIFLKALFHALPQFGLTGRLKPPSLTPWSAIPTHKPSFYPYEPGLNHRSITWFWTPRERGLPVSGCHVAEGGTWWVRSRSLLVPKKSRTVKLSCREWTRNLYFHLSLGWATTGPSRKGWATTPIYPCLCGQLWGMMGVVIQTHGFSPTLNLSKS